MSSSSTLDPSENMSDTETDGSVSPTVKERRDLLQAKLKGHRHNRLKRELPAETQWLNAVEEDQRVKKKLVEFFETSSKETNEIFSKITDTLNMLTTSITEGFSLLRQVMQAPAPQHYMPYDSRGHIYSHTQVPVHSTHPNQTFHSFSNNPRSDRRKSQNAHSASNTQDVSHTPFENTGHFSYTQALFSDE